MASLRSPDLQHFLTSAEVAIRRGCDVEAPIGAAAERMFAALGVPSSQTGEAGATRPPVCRNLKIVLERACREPGPVGALAEAFAAVEPRLEWQVRTGPEADAEPFRSSHANATITGLEGIEIRSDVRIGVSLLAPQTQYPDHRHPPEEIYLVLSGGEWRQGSGAWHEPGIGGLVYNPPNIVHAMRSAESPLLALWFLWTGPNSA